jgi:hypothetical protein
MKKFFSRHNLLIWIAIIMISIALVNSQPQESICRSQTDNIIRYFNNQINDPNKFSTTLKCSSVSKKLSVTIYLVFRKLPGIGMRDIIVNFDTNTSLIVRRHATLGSLELCLARDDSNPATYACIGPASRHINYVL